MQVFLYFPLPLTNCPLFWWGWGGGLVLQPGAASQFVGIIVRWKCGTPLFKYYEEFQNGDSRALNQAEYLLSLGLCVNSQVACPWSSPACIPGTDSFRWRHPGALALWFLVDFGQWEDQRETGGWKREPLGCFSPCSLCLGGSGSALVPALPGLVMPSPLCAPSGLGW